MNKQSFTDTKGTSWTVEVTVGTVKQARAALGVDMLDIDTFLKQVQDPVTLCDLLYVACSEQCDLDGIDSVQFGRRLGGPALRTAKDAMMEAYINFIPDPAAAEKVRVVREKYDIVGERILKVLEKKMPKILKRIDTETDTLVESVDADLDRLISGKSSTSLRASRGRAIRKN